MQPSESVVARVRAEAAKLDRYFNRILSCRVVIETPHRHHQRGAPFNLRIDLDVPGEEIVVNHAPSLSNALAQSDSGKWVRHLKAIAPHKDIYVTIHDAFKAARRRLEDYVRRLRGDIKIHGRVTTIRADKLRSGELAGF